MLGIFFFFITGLFLLIFGAELFVKGATSVSRNVGISPLFIGLTIVALGTSLPEIFVTTISVLRGAQSLAIGNLIGSNLANLLLIGGGSAIIGELIVARSVVYFHGPTMVGVTAVGYVLCADEALKGFEGITLFITFLCYITLATYIEGGQNVRGHYPKHNSAGREHNRTRLLIGNAAVALTGLVLLLVGSDWLVQSATRFSRLMGLSELVIGLTVVAVGTSLPEFATSIVATARGQQELALGNIIGSNITNLSLVLGIAVSSSKDMKIDARVLSWDFPLLLVTTSFMYLIFKTTPRIRTNTGLTLLCVYLLYVTHAILTAISHPLEPLTAWTLVAMILGVGLFFALRLRLRSRQHKSRF